MRTVRAYIGLGANVGNARRTLAAAVHALGALPGARVAGVSRLYVTRPVEVRDQPDFHNAVVALDVPAGPGEHGSSGARSSSAGSGGSGPGGSGPGGSGPGGSGPGGLGPGGLGPGASAVRHTGPIALLLALKSIERAFGRKERFRYGPRELDLDLLLFGDERVVVERPPEGRSIDPARAEATRFLEIPHAQAGRRLFVLAPLSELAPDLVPPGWDETVAQARDRQAAIEGGAAARPIARWDAESGDWVDEREQ